MSAQGMSKVSKCLMRHHARWPHNKPAEPKPKSEDGFELFKRALRQMWSEYEVVRDNVTKADIEAVVGNPVTLFEEMGFKPFEEDKTRKDTMCPFCKLNRT